MRKTSFAALAAGTLVLGGCAAGVGQNPLGAILGSVLGGSGGAYPQGGYNNQSFQSAAVNACGAYAQQRYGRVAITDVRARSQTTLRVYGTVEVNNGYQRRRFECDFRSDGRITDFDI